MWCTSQKLFLRWRWPWRMGRISSWRLGSRVWIIKFLSFPPKKRVCASAGPHFFKFTCQWMLREKDSKKMVFICRVYTREPTFKHVEGGPRSQGIPPRRFPMKYQSPAACIYMLGPIPCRLFMLFHYTFKRHKINHWSRKSIHCQNPQKLFLQKKPSTVPLGWLYTSPGLGFLKRCRKSTCFFNDIFRRCTFVGPNLDFFCWWSMMVVKTQMQFELNELGCTNFVGHPKISGICYVTPPRKLTARPWKYAGWKISFLLKTVLFFRGTC